MIDVIASVMYKLLVPATQPINLGRTNHTRSQGHSPVVVRHLANERTGCISLTREGPESSQDQFSGMTMSCFTRNQSEGGRGPAALTSIKLPVVVLKRVRVPLLPPEDPGDPSTSSASLHYRAVGLDPVAEGSV